MPGVTAAAVRAWPDASGERALAGYVVGTGEIADWRDALAEMLPEYMIPSHFVSLDALPMTPNGKVDRKALPEPGVATGRRETPPETWEEQKLAAIWQAVLKVDQVFRDDDFFELGGHSLLIARLLRRIEADYGIRLPMAALFRAPRLADMAALITSDKIEASAVIPIQPRGSRPAILWLDGGSTFIPLADRLGIDQPFYGISVDAVLEAAGGCPKHFEDAARLVADTIRETQPKGPYRIGGWCTSGILAYAVAAELLPARRRGVALLMLVHAFYPVTARRIGAVRFFLSKFRFHIRQSMLQPRGERGKYFIERLRGLSDAAALAGGREAVLQPKLRTALDRAALHYTPPVYEGDVVLFQPSEHPEVLDFVEDWKRIVTGDFASHVVPGGHRTMLEAPSVDVFAALLKPALASRDPGAPLRAVS